MPDYSNGLTGGKKMSEVSCKVVILGSTGSIGKQTLEVVDLHPDRFRVVGLAARDEMSRGARLP